MTQEAKQVSGAEIVDRLGKDQVVKAFKLLGLVDILRNSIIGDDYTPSEALSEAISLTTRGQSVARKVSIESPTRSKSAIQKGNQQRFPREARLMCLLELGNGEPLVDLKEISVDQVRAAASDEVRSKQILHPYIFGPALYVHASELFPDLLTELTHRQTVELLRGEEQGVFQIQEWLSGPFGIYQVEDVRFNPPLTRVPLQHCHDTSCSAVHDTWLRTSRTAAINARRELIHDHLSTGVKAEEWDWPDAFRLVNEEDPRRFKDDVFANLLPLIGDGLDLEEKRTLLAALITTNRKAFVGFSSHRSDLRSADDYVKTLTDAHCLQEILWFTDEMIVQALDELILSPGKGIDIPAGEVRRCVLAKPRGYGYWRTSSEMSRYGVRVSGSRNLASLRLDRAISATFEEQNGEKELEWKLRKFEGADVRAKINEALSRGDLLELIDAILVDSLPKAQKTADMIGLDAKHVNNPNLAALVAWKMGFDVPLRGDVFAIFESESRRFQDAIASQADEFEVRVVDDVSFGRRVENENERDIRGASSNYFVALEHALREGLGFATWALLVSHFEEREPFFYDSTRALSAAVDILNPRMSEKNKLNKSSPTLGPLVEGFNILGVILGERQSESEHRELPEEYLPDAARKSSLLTFPFKTDSLFDSLSEDSKERIIKLLSETHVSLERSGIVAIRNSQLHYQPNSAETGDLGKNVGQVLEAIRGLDTTGLVPALSSMREMKRGRWGKSVYVHTVRNRRRVELYSPTMVYTGPFPSLRDDQLIVPMARIASDGSPLRFSLKTESRFSKKWKPVPSRRRRSIDNSTIGGGLGIGEGARGL